MPSRANRVQERSRRRLQKPTGQGTHRGYYVRPDPLQGPFAYIVSDSFLTARSNPNPTPNTSANPVGVIEEQAVISLGKD